MSDGAEHRMALGGAALARPLRLAKEGENGNGGASDAVDAAIFGPSVSIYSLLASTRFELFAVG